MHAMTRMADEWVGAAAAAEKAEVASAKAASRASKAVSIECSRVFLSVLEFS